MTRLAFALFVFITLATLVPAAPPPPGAVAKPELTPLPKGATARLGSDVFRGRMHWLVFSPDGTTLRATAGDGTVSIWDTATGMPRAAVKVKLDREGVATAGGIAGTRVIWVQTPGGFGIGPKESTAVVCSLGDGKELSRFTLPSGPAAFHMFPLMTHNVSLSPDGRYYAAVVNDNRGVEVYDLDNGLLLHSLNSAYSPRVHLGEDCRTLYFPDNRKWRRFDLATGKELPPVADADHTIDLVRASPDGKRFITRGAFAAKEDPFLVVRDTVANKTVGRLDLGGAWPTDFRFLGSDSLLVLAHRYTQSLPPVCTLSRWNMTTLKRDWERPGPGAGEHSCLAVSPDGRHFAVTDRTSIAVLYDAATGKPIDGQDAHTGAVAWVGFTPDGSHVVTAAQDGTRTWTLKGALKSASAPPEFAKSRFLPGYTEEYPVWVTRTEVGKKAELVRWDHAKGAVGWRMPLDGPPPARLITADGKRCVGFTVNTGGKMSEVTVYDGPAGKVLHSWPVPNPALEGTPFALAPRGDVLYVARVTGPDDGNGGEMRVVGMDVSNGKETVRIDAGQFSTWYNAPGPFPMAVSPDGSKLAVVPQRPRGGNALLVFDIKSGKKLAEHDLGRNHQPALRFSPDGKRVAVWNVWATTVHVCDAESSATPLPKLDGGTYRATAAAFSPNGASLAVGYQDGTALVWDLAAK